MLEIDRLIHEPSRLAILTILFSVKEADFNFILRMSGLTRGNLSRHLSKLEDAGYLGVKKQFLGKIPNTVYSLSKKGRKSYEGYIKKMEEIIKKKA
ncbi:transcriptional regulator [candidate division WOR-3 bacterium]|nr:transcriptional regulator [candidate division WOR-3 bacterium]